MQRFEVVCGMPLDTDRPGDRRVKDAISGVARLAAELGPRDGRRVLRAARRLIVAYGAEALAEIRARGETAE